MTESDSAVLWLSVPRILARPATYWFLAVLVWLTTLTCAVTLWLGSEYWTGPEAVQTVLKIIEQDPSNKSLLKDMDPVRRSAVPDRVQQILKRLLPIVTVSSLLLGFIAGGIVIFGGRVLGRALRPEFSLSSARAPASYTMPPNSLVGVAIVVTVGLLVHLPYLGQSIQYDEANQVIIATAVPLGWLNTTLGWQNHVGSALIVRLSSAVFGINEFSVRLPGILLSSLGLGICYVWLRRNYGEIVAVLTSGLIAALPLWGEQTTLCRGYSLAFLCGTIGLSQLWKLLEGIPAGNEGRTMLWLCVAHLFGFLAHFFFLFFSIACIAVLILTDWRDKAHSPLRSAGIVWIILGLMPAALIYLPGLPATLYQNIQVSWIGLESVIKERFLYEIAFRLPGLSGVVIILFSIVGFICGLASLKSDDKRTVVLILLVAVGLPLLFRPVYLYPRFFIHLVPLLFVIVLPIAWIAERGFHKEVATAVSVGIVAILWALPKPWDMPANVDLRSTAQVLSTASGSGKQIVAHSFLQRGLVFYLPNNPIRFINLSTGVPSNADVLVQQWETQDVEPNFIGFAPVARLPGREHTVTIYKRETQLPGHVD
jgi:hypothetical protein